MTARVLVVDDIPANVKLLEAKLSAEYFGVVTATNGRDAIALCERGEVDIVLLDVMMPGMNGFDVCRRLKGAPATAHIPVIIVTTLDQPRDRLRLIAGRFVFARQRESGCSGIGHEKQFPCRRKHPCGVP